MSDLEFAKDKILMGAERRSAVMPLESRKLTAYHEGGHAMKALLSVGAKYRSHQDMGESADGAEIFSTIQENWAFVPDVVEEYVSTEGQGSNTGAVEEIFDILEKMQEADDFMKTKGALRVLANALSDLRFHQTSIEDYHGYQDIIDNALNELGTKYPYEIASYAFTRFNHLFDTPNSGYAAGYYSYLYADSRAEHGFRIFPDDDPYNPEISARLLAYYACDMGHPEQLAYRNYTGEDATEEAFLRKMGVTVHSCATGAVLHEEVTSTDPGMSL